MDTPESDTPWNEEQWERFMKRSEARADRFGELLETLIDHPDRDRIIAREMGWEEHDEESGDQGETAAFDALADEPPSLEELDAVASDDEDADPITGVRISEPVENIPAYKLAYTVGLEVHRGLEPYLHKLSENDSSEAAERLTSAYGNSMVPGAKIAGGHGIGYEDDAICGHIVNLRKGLAAGQAACEDLKWLGEHGHLPADLAARLCARLDEVLTALQERIAALRARVWWD